ncbi:MAG: hypothetical protein OEU26_07195 [Candidatus Tectomicrobia bacterium]|nr:hypothetical protein [Candidatus Tectomicrobia bacterium]
MAPFVFLLEIHKVMDCMQEAGEGLKLRYDKGIFGPHAENPRHLLSHIEGCFMQGYADAAPKRYEGEGTVTGLNRWTMTH